MRKTFLSIVSCLLLSFVLFSFIKANNKNTLVAAASVKDIIVNKTSAGTENNKAAAVKAASAALYEHLNLGELGLSAEAMDYAYKGYTYLREKGMLDNSNIITVCDFSQSSKKKRMYIIDVKNEKVLLNTYVAHGRNSGVDYATKFSNIPESLQSSLGFYITKDTYSGKHGLSLKLIGKERGWNDNAESRAVVVHGADYIGDNRLGAPYMGRSFGCPAVPQAQAERVINYIKNGSCLFIYHPSKNYLTGSKLLNS
ncbi:MAG: murein L,D-transpeptidase catalytic domain family protein [Flavisolibacter sp.]|nr:murein L,D-transpeptidase catalytic domain family protein [Flavisolibacter sp.]